MVPTSLAPGFDCAPTNIARASLESDTGCNQQGGTHLRWSALQQMNQNRRQTNSHSALHSRVAPCLSADLLWAWALASRSHPAQQPLTQPDAAIPALKEEANREKADCQRCVGMVIVADSWCTHWLPAGFCDMFVTCRLCPGFSPRRARLERTLDRWLVKRIRADHSIQPEPVAEASWL